MASTTYHHGDLKAALIKAALELLQERGMQALSLRTLAAEVGVSHMAPYAHFKNKTELFQAIAASGFDAMAERMDKVDQSMPAPELILNYGAEYIGFARSNAPLYRLMLSEVQAPGPKKASKTTQHMSSELRVASTRPYKLLKAAFARVTKDDAMQDIRAQGAWSMVHGMAALLIDGQLSIPKGMNVKSFLAAAALQVPRI